MNTIITQTKEICVKDQKFSFRVAGRGPVITSPTKMGNWLLVPYEQDESNIPLEAYARVTALRRAGYKIEGFIIAHELPEEVPQAKPKREPIKVPWKKIGQILEVVIGIIAAIAGLMALGLVYAIAYDPILIAVLEDGTWLEVIAWVE